MEKFTLEFDLREVSTILAALRCWQESRKSSHLMEIATNDGDIEALDDDEISDLCIKINCE